MKRKFWNYLSWIVGAIGAGLALHHKFDYDRWTDGKLKCHGSAGVLMTLFSLAIQANRLKSSSE